MTITVTDLFCGAGGSSLGAEAAGLTLSLAANHWSTAIDVHQAHFPTAAHDCADISQVDPRRYPRTDILLASPECTNHSQARGISRRRQDPSLWDAPDPKAERSRATMWDVPRFAEQMRYDAIVVENVVEATKWVNWGSWLMAMTELGYEHRVLSHNSMHHGVAQSRDRIYVVFWRQGLKPDLEMERSGWCPRCDHVQPARQAWKSERRIGRYRQQWRWACVACSGTVEPPTTAAAEIIDWSLDCPRIGDRTRPLAAATRARILAGLQRYGWAPITTSGAGNTQERTPGNRARPLTEPVAVQQTTATTAMAIPPGFLVNAQSAPDGSPRVRNLDDPAYTMAASSRPSVALPGFQIQFYGKDSPSRKRGIDEPTFTQMASGAQGLVLTNNGQAQSLDRPVPTVPTRDRFALLSLDEIVDECGFRMLAPHEIAAAMAFPVGYIPADLTKSVQVKLAGNAVTPPVMQWICGRLAQALEAVA